MMRKVGELFVRSLLTIFGFSAVLVRCAYSLIHHRYLCFTIAESSFLAVSLLSRLFSIKRL
ncbi:hypothetical protein BDP27DRAFT_1320238 [Rhodocollybia butyracea]|uniref:Uncharacterized protein n=1 Tax=Rhodocollybia butyracea TaxID=206335 RepID=A0A9P5UA23_9AGAR|nr:hypothetical protein BDP27DRAFT_1320238 [Rhodocollybia butyracea]